MVSAHIEALKCLEKLADLDGKTDLAAREEAVEALRSLSIRQQPAQERHLELLRV